MLQWWKQILGFHLFGGDFVWIGAKFMVIRETPSISRVGRSMVTDGTDKI